MDRIKLLFSRLSDEQKDATRSEVIGMIAGLIADRMDDSVPEDDKLTLDDLIKLTKNRLAYDIAKIAYTTPWFPRLMKLGKEEAEKMLRYRKEVDMSEDLEGLEYCRDGKY